MLKVLSETLDKSEDGFCVENDGGLAVGFRGALQDIRDRLRSIFNARFRRNAESRVVFTIDDANQKFFRSFKFSWKLQRRINTRRIRGIRSRRGRT